MSYTNQYIPKWWYLPKSIIQLLSDIQDMVIDNEDVFTGKHMTQMDEILEIFK